MSDSDDDIPVQSYWPSVTDLFLTLFIIAIAIVAVVFCALLPTNNVGKDRALVHAVGNDLLHVRAPINRLRKELELQPVGVNARPSEVITALSETCDTGVTQVNFLRSRIKDLQERLSQLMGAADPQAEMERILKENEQLKRKLESLEQQMARIGTIGNDPEGVNKLLRENEDLRRENTDLNKPPNIQITEQKEEYRFAPGSSVMGPDFVEGLNQNEFARLAGEIVDRQEEGRVKVDTLEIIGHTDGMPIKRAGNLDQNLPEILVGTRSDISSLKPGSNNDLGLLRALAVRIQWERYIETHEHREILQKVKIRCYSAGQTILPHAGANPIADDFRKPDSSARRIEMRLTRLGN